MKDLIFMSVQPADKIFWWQLRTQLYNFRKYNISKDYHIVIYLRERQIEDIKNKDFMFNKLAEEYPEANFYYIADELDECFRLIKIFNYPPLIRPWCLQKLFKMHPEWSNKAVFYLDCDVIFTKAPDFINKFKDDDICYLSDTQTYISAAYFDSKIKDVLPDKLEAYKRRDVLQEATFALGINREIAERNQKNTGGAQYLLKNIDSKFWSDILDGCMVLRTCLTNINEKFFISEDKGFQVWCADMWAVLWTLWKREQITQCPEEMDFLWSSAPLEEWETKYIYHDAQPTGRCFNKMNYRDGITTPYEDDLYGIDETKCTIKYVQEILNSNL